MFYLDPVLRNCSGIFILRFYPGSKIWIFFSSRIPSPKATKHRIPDSDPKHYLNLAYPNAFYVAVIITKNKKKFPRISFLQSTKENGALAIWIFLVSASLKSIWKCFQVYSISYHTKL